MFPKSYFLVAVTLSIVLQHSVCRAKAVDMMEVEEGSAGSGDLNKAGQDTSNTIDPTIAACQRVPMLVNFADFSWNRILVPKTVDIGKCVGSCADSRYGRTVHAHLKSLLGLKNCCVPTSFKSIGVVITLNGTLSISRFYNGLVDQCGCI